MTELPNPLTPADCDLRGYTWMPLDVVRVIDSDTFGLSTGEEFKTAFRLWAKSWLQVPAASLPDDDRLLAHLAGLELPAWKKRKAISLRGFIKCSDGRLYHPVIAEKALEAMGKREGYAAKEENEQSRQQRYRERRKHLFETLRGHGIVPSKDTKMDELERLVASFEVSQSVTGETQNVTSDVTGDVTGDVTYDVAATAKSRAEQTGQDSKPKNQEEPSPLQPPMGDDAPNGSSPVSKAIELAVYLRQRGVVGANSFNPHISTWADDVRVTTEILDAALSKARSSLEGKAPGVNYLAPIVTDLLNPKPMAAKKPADDWHRSQAGIDRKAKELGMYARGNESYDSFKERIWAELRNREQQGAAA